MKTKSGSSKVNISMPKELFDYLKKLVDEHNAKPENAYCPTDFSKMVQKSIRAMMEADRKEFEEGKAQTVVGVVIRSTSENSDTGPSTRATKTSRKVG
jgi:hypothetical protein